MWVFPKYVCTMVSVFVCSTTSPHISLFLLCVTNPYSYVYVILTIIWISSYAFKSTIKVVVLHQHLIKSITRLYNFIVYAYYTYECFVMWNNVLILRLPQQDPHICKELENIILCNGIDQVRYMICVVKREGGGYTKVKNSYSQMGED